MEVKVHQKRGKYENVIPIVGILFPLFSIIIISIVSPFFSSSDLGESLRENIFKIPVAIALFEFLILLLAAILKLKNKYAVKLISKRNEIYKGKEITLMKFELLDQITFEKIDPSSEDYFIYECFTYGENDLLVNEKYELVEKDVSNKIQFISFFKGDNDFKKSNVSLLKIVFAALLLIFIVQICLLILCIYLFNSFEYYIFIVICLIIIYKLFEIYRKSKDRIQNGSMSSGLGGI